MDSGCFVRVIDDIFAHHRIFSYLEMHGRIDMQEKIELRRLWRENCFRVRTCMFVFESSAYGS